jgi:hypothetical protein
MKPSRTEQAHSSKQRPARIPMTGGNKLTIPPHLIKDGFQYYWGIDQKGMIEQMEGAYWEKVLDSDGKALTVPAGNGETHYAMCIEQKYYDEDMARQQKQNIETTNRTAQALGEDEYVPEGRTNVTEREII